MGNYDYFAEIFQNIKDTHATCSMGDSNNDFMKYEHLKHLFGYSRKPIMAQNNVDLYEIFRKGTLIHEGKLYIHDASMYARTGVHSLTDFPNLNDTVKKLYKPEVWQEIVAINNKISDLNNDPDTVYTKSNFRLLHGLGEGMERPMSNYIDYALGSIKHYKNLDPEDHAFFYSTPMKYETKFFLDLLKVIETMEIFVDAKSNSEAELYSKLYIRNNIILKNQAEDYINSINNYGKYTENNKDKLIDILALLYKAQENREVLFGNIDNIPGKTKHYTPEEFAILATNFALNMAYEIFTNGPRAEEFYTIMEENSRRENIFSKSLSFLYDCQNMEYMDNYIKEHPELYDKYPKEDIEELLTGQRKNLVYNYLYKIFNKQLQGSYMLSKFSNPRA